MSVDWIGRTTCIRNADLRDFTYWLARIAVSEEMCILQRLSCKGGITLLVRSWSNSREATSSAILNDINQHEHGSNSRIEMHSRRLCMHKGRVAPHATTVA